MDCFVPGRGLLRGSHLSRLFAAAICCVDEPAHRDYSVGRAIWFWTRLPGDNDSDSAWIFWGVFWNPRGNEKEFAPGDAGALVARLLYRIGFDSVAAHSERLRADVCGVFRHRP